MILPIKDKIKSLISKTKGDFSQQVLERLKDLPVKDSLNESVQILTELKENSTLTPVDRLRSLYVITLINTPHLVQYKKDRSKIKLNNKKIAESMDRVVNPYYRMLFDAYQELALSLIEKKVVLLKERQDMALFFGRMNFVAFEMLIWRYFDHQPKPEGTWKILNKVYQFLELHEALNVPVTFPETKEIADVATVFARVLMLSTLENATLSPKDLSVSAEILRINLMGVEFENEYVEKRHAFYINLHDDKTGPVYIRALDNPDNSRYWATAELTHRIEEYLLAISMQKLPKNSVIRKVDSLPVLTRVLKRLNQEWSPKFYKRQRRISTRKKAEKTLYIAQGLQNIVKQLSIFNGDDALDARFISELANNTSDHYATSVYDDQAIEKWKMVDVSETGFAVDLGVEPSGWIESGRLIGCQNPNHAEEYAIAEVKTVRKQSDGHYRAGIEILSSLSQTMQLHPVEKAQKEETLEVATGFYLEDDDDREDVDVTSGISCLYMPKSGTHGRQKSSVILPLAEYQPNKRFKIDSVDKMIQLGGAIDIHQDWVRAFVRII